MVTNPEPAPPPAYDQIDMISGAFFAMNEDERRRIRSAYLRSTAPRPRRVEPAEPAQNGPPRPEKPADGLVAGARARNRAASARTYRRKARARGISTSPNRLTKLFAND
jgi:hypothetical protein